MTKTLKLVLPAYCKASLVYPKKSRTVSVFKLLAAAQKAQAKKAK